MFAPRAWLAALLVGLIGTPSEMSAHRGAARLTPATAVHVPDDTLPSLDGATTWLESRPLSAAGLRGKVVVVDFSTYTCINSLRMLPYVRAWAEKYRNRGVVVINVQAPEFEFEKNLDNVRQAVREQRIDFPTAVDNDHAIWRAFDNDVWPALYIADAQGRIRYHHFGEGAYDEAERVIQQLLAEAGHGDPGDQLSFVHGRGIEAPADWNDLLSKETYVGYDRAENFASPGGAAKDRSHTYAAPDSLPVNQWALSGDWTVGHQIAVANAPNGKIVFRFHARDLHLVLGPAANGMPVRFLVRIDGQPPGNAHGGDVDSQGNGKITEQRLYQLIRQQQPIADRTFEIEFLDAGAQAVVFTFG